jgi:hypothetical protein
MSTPRALGAAAIAVAAGAFFVGRAQAAAERPPFLATDGSDWAAMGEKEKLALLRGFLIGAAYAEKGRGKHVSPDALEALRQQGQLRFVFVPELYKARLEDLYFYKDQRPVPVYEALRRIEAQIRTGNSPPPPPQ